MRCSCPRTQQGWVLLPLTYSSSQKIIPSDALWKCQTSSLNTQLAPSQAQCGSWHHHYRTWGARKKASDLLLSHLPPAAARPAHPQHKWLGLLWCLPLLLHIQRLLGHPGCDQCPEKQGKGDTEAHPAILRALPAASQLPKALGAQRGCSCPEDTI